ncbi:hypothetical protein FIBSPDRAFT_857416 [Athelia psychrophila]|uniref:Uncharacterized protein n=1 Tax=Athelia psychrophila TaxID=1759441 RepID=A0A166MTU1_9AGAM|nr:hypothetical protein FIBSPDRAFT_857416 [Fibularhizoctonia sp. CBS 109695]
MPSPPAYITPPASTTGASSSYGNAFPTAPPTAPSASPTIPAVSAPIVMFMLPKHIAPTDAPPANKASALAVYPAIVEESAAPGAAVGRRRSAREIDAARPALRRWARVCGYPWCASGSDSNMYVRENASALQEFFSSAPRHWGWARTVLISFKILSGQPYTRTLSAGEDGEDGEMGRRVVSLAHGRRQRGAGPREGRVSVNAAVGSG